MSTVVITQPTYLPWLGYFQLMAQADHFIFLDTVQFERRSWQCRNRLRNPTGELFYLTIPVAKQPRGTAIQDVALAKEPSDWPLKHRRAIERSLGKAPFFDAMWEALTGFYEAPPQRLVNFTLPLVKSLAGTLDLAPEFHQASEINAEGRRSTLLCNLCQSVGATRYLSAAGSRDYLERDRNLFDDAGIAVEYQDWLHPSYPQVGVGFQSHLAVIDALSNVGPDLVREMIAS